MALTKLSNKQIESYQDSTARINIFEGPVRAGKSYISLLRWLDFCKNGPKGPLIICGRTDKTIKRNIISPLQELIGNAVQYSIGKGEVTLYGRTMYVVGANDDRAEAKIRGSEFAGSLLDEVSLLPENFFKMLLSRLSIPGSKLFCSTNPDSPYHWFKTDFIDREEELDLKVFSYNIRDNPTLSEKYIKDLSAEYQGLWYKRYIEGIWCLADGAVYDFFNDDIHVIQMPKSEATYYIVGVDYGTTNPCVFTMIGYNAGAYPNMWLEREYYYDSKKELRQKSDYDYSLDLVEFIRGYNIKRIYIDPSAASFKQELRRNGISNVQDAVNDVLPGIRFTGQLLTNGTFKVCSNCVETIKEFSNYLWDSKASERGEDKPIKKFDHCFDGSSLITTLKGQVPIEQIKEGDRVLTPIGYKKVLKMFVHEDEVYEFDMFGKKIKCTKNHKFYTVNRGWIKAKDMLLSDILLININELECQQNAVYFKKSDIIGTHEVKIIPLENIFEQISKTKKGHWYISIEKCGDIITEKYQKDIASTISISTHPTMKLATLNLYPILNIIYCTEERTQNYLLESLEILFAKYVENISTELQYIQNIVQFHVEIDQYAKTNINMSLENANIVRKFLKLLNIKKQNVVQENVLIKCEKRKIEKNQSASIAENFLNILKELPGNIAQDHVPCMHVGKNQNVYNLHVEDFHGFYVNNILTLNCLDSIRYALYTHFFKMNLREEFTAADADRLERQYYKRYN